MRNRIFTLAILIITAALWSSCQGGTGGGPVPPRGTGGDGTTATFAIYNDTVANNLSSAGISSTGTLTTTSNSPFLAGALPSQIVMSGNNKVAYVLNKNSNSVSMFGVNSAGTLTSLAAAVSTGTNPVGMIVDQQNRFAMVANQGSNDISIYAIALDGTLSQIAGSPFNVGISPVAITAEGNFIYVASTTQVFGLVFNATTGTFTTVAGSPFDVGFAGTVVSAMRLSNVAKTLYLTDSARNGVLIYGVNGNTGVITVVGSVASGTQPVAITTDTNDHLIYTANFGSNDISAYTIDSTNGNLTAVTGSPYTTAAGPVALAVDPVNNFLLVANNTSKQLSVYGFNTTTGTLAQAAGSPFSAGGGPTTVAVAVP